MIELNDSINAKMNGMDDAEVRWCQFSLRWQTTRASSVSANGSHILAIVIGIHKLTETTENDKKKKFV